MSECPVRRNARIHPDETALRDDRERLSWRDCDGAVDACVERLRTAGVGRSDRVAVAAGNSIDYAVLVFAALRMGAVLVPLNLRHGIEFRLECVKTVEAALLCFDLPLRSFAETARVPHLAIDEARKATGADGPCDIDDKADATIVFTSGSSGRPRGVVLTAGNHFASADASNANLPFGPGDCWLADLPFFHVGGLAILMRGALSGGATFVHDRFDARGALELAASGDVTHLSCVPRMLDRLIRMDRRPLAKLKGILLGGAGADEALLEACRGLPVLPTWGMTEGASQLCTAAPGDEIDPAGPRMRPLRGVEVRVVDGAIAVRGPQLFTRYLGGGGGADDGGWFATGDLGHLDDEGRLEILGRGDAVIISGGENIHPADIARVVRRHEAVTDCAIVAVPSKRWGHRPYLYVEACGLAPSTFARWLADRLPKLLRPDGITIVEELPRLGLYKIDAQALRAMCGEDDQGDSENPAS